MDSPVIVKEKQQLDVEILQMTLLIQENKFKADIVESFETNLFGRPLCKCTSRKNGKVTAQFSPKSET